MRWSTACLDWEERIVARRSLLPCAPLFPDEAAAAEDVFRQLRIVDAPGSPTIGESCADWAFDLPRAVFGAYDHETGRRLIREFLLLVSKKNSKSTLAAGIMLTALIRNWRQSAEFFIVAPTIEVAQNSFKPASDMVAADEELSAIFHVQAHYRTITHRNTGASLKVIAADNETVSGKKATGVLVDELWLFGKRANAENMLREATGGLVSRPEGFVIYLTTQSDEPPAGVFAKKLHYFRRVRDGEVDDPRSLGLLYEFPRAMVETKEHLNPANFYVTNPNVGVSVDDEWLRDEFRKAQDGGADSLCGFAAKHLNVEIGLALRSDRWVGADYWQEAADPSLTLESLLARSEVAVVGIDGGGLDDLLGVAVLGRERDTRRWLLWGHAWANRVVLERRKEIAPLLKDFAEQGDLTVVDEPGQDVAELADVVEQVAVSGKLAERSAVGLDPVGIAQIVDELNERGLGNEEGKPPVLVAVSQGWKLSGAIKTAERGLKDKTLLHGGQPLMAWSVGNAKVEPRGNALTITKAAAGSAKIDPLMAALDAVALMGMNPAARASVYEEHGLTVI